MSFVYERWLILWGRRKPGYKTGIFTVQKSNAPLTPGEYINFELEVAGDRLREPEELRAMDEAWVRDIGSQLPLLKDNQPNAFLRMWLNHRCLVGSESLGNNVSVAVQRLRTLLVVVGLLSGVALARIALHYDGTHPVNVLHAWGLLIGLQLLALALLLFHAFWRRLMRGDMRTVLLGALQYAMDWLTRRQGGAVSEKVGSIAEPLKILRKSPRIKQAETWLLLSLSQWLAIFFNAGALLTLFYLVGFTDLAFSWETTLQVTPSQLHQILNGIALPWAWLDPQLMVSETLVEASQYFRLEGRYRIAPAGTRSMGVDSLGGWWPFLAMSLLTYGLLLRIGLWGWAQWRLRKVFADFSSRTIDCQQLHERLMSYVAGWREVEQGESIEDQTVRRVPVEQPAAITSHATKDCVAILWRDIPLTPERLRDDVSKKMGYQVLMTLDAGGRQGDLLGAESAKAIRQLLPRDLQVMVCVEMWESPGKAFKTFLHGLRSELPEHLAIYVIVMKLVDQGPELVSSGPQFDIWQRHLADLGDPYTGILKYARGSV